MSLDRPSLFRCLDRLDFGEGSWAVAGSGPMLAHGIVSSIDDSTSWLTSKPGSVRSSKRLPP